MTVESCNYQLSKQFWISQLRRCDTTVVAKRQMSSKLEAITRHTTAHIALEWIVATVGSGVDRIHDDTAEVDVTRWTVVQVGWQTHTDRRFLRALSWFAFHN